MEPLFRLLPGPQSLPVRYGWTVLFILAAYFLRYVVDDAAGPYSSLLFILPVVVSALLFDRATGFFAIALSVAAMASLLEWDDRKTIHAAALSLFVFVGVCLVFIAEGLHRALEEAEKAHEATRLLLQEMSHRVKNKFAIVSSIIGLQARQGSPEVRKALEDIGARVNVIATVHNYLQLSRHEGRIEMKEYLTGLSGSLQAALDSGSKSVALACECDKVMLTPDKALAVGVIVNELVTNAFKYGFEGVRSGRVDVRLVYSGGTVTLSVADNGRGCPEKPREGLGMRLVTTFSQQLGGSASWKGGAEGGCTVEVTFIA